MDTTRRLPIRRTHVICADALSPAEREELAAQLFPIFDETLGGIDEQTFVETVLDRGPGTRIAIFYGRGGEIAGFSSARVIRLEVEGTAHAIFHAGVYIRPRYRGGAAAARFGLIEALRLRLSSPSIRLWYVVGTSSPAPYSLYARTMATFYPHPEIEPTPEAEAIVRAFKSALGLTTVGADPYLIQHERWGVVRSGDRIRHAGSLRGDPMAAYYLRRNPCFEDGTRLLVCIPLDWKNVLSGLLPPLRWLLRGSRRLSAALPAAPLAASRPAVGAEVTS